VLQQPQLAIDVIFSDIEMPGSMDGFGLAQWARSNCPGLDVILTGSVPRAVNAAADLCESGGTVPKPYEPQVVHGSGDCWPPARRTANARSRPSAMLC